MNHASADADRPGDHAVVPLRIPVPVTAVQGALALDLEPRLDPPSHRGAGRQGATVVPIDRAVRASAEQWSRRFVQAAVEIVGGDRPVSQLARWSSAEVHQDLARRALLVARAAGRQPGTGRRQPVRPRVVSAHSCVVDEGVVEVAVHVRYGLRSRAVAARFEDRQDRWLCTALDFA